MRPHACSRIERFSPLFCRTFRPGASGVPRALRVMFVIFRSSTLMISKRRTRFEVIRWQALLDRTLWRRRSLARWRTRFRRRLLPRFDRAILRCARPMAFQSCCSGANLSPLLSVARFRTRTSIPTFSPVFVSGAGPCSYTRSTVQPVDRRTIRIVRGLVSGSALCGCSLIGGRPLILTRVHVG